MTATATHDTKRGEDARMRILALSELAYEWAEAVQRLDGAARRASAATQERCAPSRAHRYMLYQALIGAWPLSGIDRTFVKRMTAYALKAAREGKLETSWAVPDADYENALTAFVERILDPAASGDFIGSLSEFAKRAALLGALNSLSQLTLKMTLPGVPDIYQGTELWDLSLVDPDNRRAVDFTARERAAAELEGPVPWRDLCADWPSGRVKLALTRSLLACRRQHADLFMHGNYQPLSVNGRDADKVIAFSRSHHRGTLVVAVARHFYDMTQGGLSWPDAGAWAASIRLPPRASFRNLIEDERPLSRSGEIEASKIFGAVPVALLIGR